MGRICYGNASEGYCLCAYKCQQLPRKKLHPDSYSYFTQHNTTVQWAMVAAITTCGPSFRTIAPFLHAVPAFTGPISFSFLSMHTARVSLFAPQVILPFAAALAQEEPASHVAIELAWGASVGAAPLPGTAPSAGAAPLAGAAPPSGAAPSARAAPPAAPASAGQPVSTAGGPLLSSGVHTRWHRRVWVGKDDVCTLGSLVDAAKDVGLEDQGRPRRCRS